MLDVLIVEDDPMVGEINRKYLDLVPGFKCVGVATGADEAFAKLAQVHVDLVLLDLFMPGRNGLQVLAEIRSRAQAVDVIVISAASDIQSVNTALRLGAVDYLIKPFQFERFGAALRKYQEERDLFDKRGNISQNELDRLLFHEQVAVAKGELPKGLTRSTLQLVVDRIEQFGDDAFSTEDLSVSIGVSRVSIRKYLNFLENIGFLSTNLNYRTVGRPLYTYRMHAANRHSVHSYLREKHE